MRCLIISGNPKTDGLCDSVTKEVVAGAQDAGAEVHILKTDNIGRCRVCKDGWGICRAEHKCAFGKDGFDDAQLAVKNADVICLITPVYWGEMTESLKCFTDRLRRCEFGQNGALSGKKVLLIASPGGSGNGMLSALEQMDRFCRNVGADIVDYIGVNRQNCEYKRVAAYEAARALVACTIT